jgi:hypothetical protein
MFRIVTILNIILAAVWTWNLTCRVGLILVIMGPLQTLLKYIYCLFIWPNDTFNQTNQKQNCEQVSELV